MQVFVAAAFLKFQILLVGAALAAALTTRPLATVSRTKWDETGERLTAEHVFGFAGTAEQQRGVYHVLVCRMALWIVWRDRPAITMQVVFPPLMVANWKAESLWSAIYRHPLYAPIFEARRRLFSVSLYSFDIAETDAAYGNERLVAYLMMSSPERGTIFQWNMCGNHQTNLVEAALILTNGFKLLSKLYSLSLFLRAESHFARLVLAVPRVIHANLIVKDTRTHGDPPSLATDFNKDMCKYIVCHYRRFAICRREQPRRGRRQGRAQQGDESATESDGDFLDARPEDLVDRGVKRIVLAARDFLRLFKGRRGARTGVVPSERWPVASSPWC